MCMCMFLSNCIMNLKYKKETTKHVHTYGLIDDKVVLRVFAGVTVCSSFAGVLATPGLNIFFVSCSFIGICLEMNMKAHFKNKTHKIKY